MPSGFFKWNNLLQPLQKLTERIQYTLANNAHIYLVFIEANSIISVDFKVQTKYQFDNLRTIF